MWSDKFGRALPHVATLINVWQLLRRVNCHSGAVVYWHADNMQRAVLDWHLPSYMMDDHTCAQGSHHSIGGHSKECWTRTYGSFT